MPLEFRGQPGFNARALGSTGSAQPYQKRLVAEGKARVAEWRAQQELNPSEDSRIPQKSDGTVTPAVTRACDRSDLGEVVHAWSSLPELLKAAVMAIVRSVSNERLPSGTSAVIRRQSQTKTAAKQSPLRT